MIKNIYHLIIAMLSGYWYRFPSRKLKVIGVTGTDGKTTTTFLIDAILRVAGKKTALINGLVFKVGDIQEKNTTNNSTPGRFRLRALLAQALREKCEYAIIEVTSIGLLQHRLWRIAFDVAVFTNLSSEHLDVHKTLDAYRAVKGRLFQQLAQFNKKDVPKVSVINKDDESAEYFSQFNADKKLTFSLHTPGADVFADSIHVTDSGVDFVLYAGNEHVDVHLPLEGEVNVANALAASAVALSQGISLAVIKQGLESASLVEGRLEKINQGQPFRVIVDYAHTPNAMEKMMQYARSIAPEGKIIAVFGSAGGRDSLKRPLLGAVAAQHADFSVLTTDDPRFEDPAQIIAEIEQGFKTYNKEEPRDYIKVLDRYWAIEKACEQALPGDVVLILGMGASGMYVKDKKIEWDDRAVVRQLLSEKYGGNV